MTSAPMRLLAAMVYRMRFGIISLRRASCGDRTLFCNDCIGIAVLGSTLELLYCRIAAREYTVLIASLALLRACNQDSAQAAEEGFGGL